jgi:hypothetical protein
LRAGPVSFTRRLIDPKNYQEKVFKYMKDFKEDSLSSAQGNADAYLASPGAYSRMACMELTSDRNTRKMFLSGF